MSKVTPIAPRLPLPLAELALGRPVSMSIDDSEREPGVVNGHSALGVIFRDESGDDWEIDEQDIEDGTVKFYQRDET